MVGGREGGRDVRDGYGHGFSQPGSLVNQFHLLKSRAGTGPLFPTNLYRWEE